MKVHEQTSAMRPITDGDAFELTCGDLRVKVLTPWSRLYHRTRFMHSAFMAEVWLGDKCFTTTEAGPHGSAVCCGSGLCSEYKNPAGFDPDVAPGETWLKPGVGVLVRGEKPWHFQDETESAGLPTEVWAGASSARFVCTSPIVNGYGYLEERTIELSDHSIRLDIRFANTGEKPWKMIEYCHNFLSFHNRPTDEHHHLLMPTVAFDGEAADGFGTLQTWNGFGWEYEPKQLALYRFPETRDAAFAWQLYLDDSPSSIGERVSEKTCLMQACLTKSFLAPEAFVNIDLQPGEEKRWTREWFFRG